jgi:hypothetical protein
MLRVDQEDLAQECNAYMKIKLFMANRIAELELQVDKLQKDFSMQLMSNLALNDLIKSYNFLNTNINAEEINECKCKRSKLDLSKDSIESISLLGIAESSVFDNEIKKGVNYNDVDDNINSQVNNDDRQNEAYNFKGLKQNFNFFNMSPTEEKRKNNSLYEKIICQNVKLAEENIKLKDDLQIKNFNLSKLMTEKVLLINELRELLNSLNKIEFHDLDKLFLRNSEITSKIIRTDAINKLDVPSSLGIKYNILSAYSIISSLLFSYNYTNCDDSDNMQTSSLYEGIKNSRKIFKNFEKEFETILNRNLRKQSILKEYDDSDE